MGPMATRCSNTVRILQMLSCQPHKRFTSLPWSPCTCSQRRQVNIRTILLSCSLSLSLPFYLSPFNYIYLSLSLSLSLSLFLYTFHYIYSSLPFTISLPFILSPIPYLSLYLFLLTTYLWAFSSDIENKRCKILVF